MVRSNWSRKSILGPLRHLAATITPSKWVGNKLNDLKLLFDHTWAPRAPLGARALLSARALRPRRLNTIYHPGGGSLEGVRARGERTGDWRWVSWYQTRPGIPGWLLLYNTHNEARDDIEKQSAEELMCLTIEMMIIIIPDTSITSLERASHSVSKLI